jgi:hypothetical protein
LIYLKVKSQPWLLLLRMLILNLLEKKVVIDHTLNLVKSVSMILLSMEILLSKHSFLDTSLMLVVFIKEL